MAQIPFTPPPQVGPPKRIPEKLPVAPMAPRATVSYRAGVDPGAGGMPQMPGMSGAPPLPPQIMLALMAAAAHQGAPVAKARNAKVRSHAVVGALTKHHTKGKAKGKGKK